MGNKGLMLYTHESARPITLALYVHCCKKNSPECAVNVGGICFHLELTQLDLTFSD